MRCNNKHVLEESSENENLVEVIISYVDNEIKNDRHENITSR